MRDETRHTRHHSNLVMKRCFRPDETTELGTDRSMAPPLDEGVEDDLVTAYNNASASTTDKRNGRREERERQTISILLPPRKLINNSQRHTLLEPSLRVCRPPQSIPLQQEPKREIKVLRDVSLRPLLPPPIRRVDERRVLHCGPAEKGVVSHKRCYFAISAPKRDAFVDAPREVGYAVFEVMVCHLHDILKVGKLSTCEVEGEKRERHTRFMLDNSHIRRLSHFPCSIPETILQKCPVNLSQLPHKKGYSKHTSGTTVSESIIRIISPTLNDFPFAQRGFHFFPLSSYISSCAMRIAWSSR